MDDQQNEVRPGGGMTHAGFQRRLSRGIVTGMAAGLAAGALLGIIIGTICCDPPSRGFWMALVASVVAGVGIGTFVGGLSRLESPEPGSEPSDVARPIRDEPELTKEEGSDEESPGSPGRTPGDV